MADDQNGLRLALVDDDPLFRGSVAANLDDAGFSVIEYESGEDFIARRDQSPPPNLVVMDWKMPGLTGIETLKAMRAAGDETPVIFLTSMSDRMYEEAALNRGAVDFVEKSRGFSILLRRIELILDRAPTAMETQTNGPLTLEGKRAFWKGEEVNLTHSEFEIIALLSQNPGKDISYRKIYDLVRGEGFRAGVGEDGYRANVRTFMKRIRQKFRKIDDDFEAVENYPGFGYRWKANGEE